MAVVTKLQGLSAPLVDDTEIQSFLTPHGITFERWPVPDVANSLARKETLTDDEKETLIECFRDKLDTLAETEGYTTADMVCLAPSLPGLGDALANFDREHYHTDDEVRFIVDGTGVFGFEGEDGRKFLIEVQAGEYIVIPANRWHWFYMKEGTGIKALRIFKDREGWTPYYKAVVTP